jgi:hypothetical protein
MSKYKTTFNNQTHTRTLTQPVMHLCNTKFQPKNFYKIIPAHKVSKYSQMSYLYL